MDRERMQAWVYNLTAHANASTLTVETVEELVAEAQRTLNDYANEVHAANQKWWHDLKTGEPIKRNFGELVALCHSELSEALEGDRKNLSDQHLPHRKSVEVELVDCLIRIFDIGGGLKLDLQGAYKEKMAYNAQRADHKIEQRLRDDGKKY